MRRSRNGAGGSRATWTKPRSGERVGTSESIEPCNEITLGCVRQPPVTMRRGRESNPRIAVLQTAALPLGYPAEREVEGNARRSSVNVSGHAWPLREISPHADLNRRKRS